MFSGASEYCIQSLLLPRKTTAPQPHTQKAPPSPPPAASPQPLNVTPKPEKGISIAGKGKTEFLSLRCGVTEMTLTTQ